MWRFSTAIWLAAAALAEGLLAGCTPTRSVDAASPRPSMTGSSISPLAVAPSASQPAQAYPRLPESQLRAKLTPLQFEVTQNAATEPPFQNTYWNNHEPGIYVDVATGEPLFSSRDKFESGTGWPSFVRPVESGHVVEHSDTSFGMTRTEVVSTAGGSHLGHVFDDGPAPTGKRYCINSAALRFIPVDRLMAEGYGDYAPQFGASPSEPPPPAASSNSCAVPPPGTTPGCHSTLQVAILGQRDGDERLAHTPGVLEIARGYEGQQPAVKVTFDPAKVSYSDLLAAWAQTGEPHARVFARDDAQRQSAAAKALPVADAVPFRRDP